jgi:hypothetical protein
LNEEANEHRYEAKVRLVKLTKREALCVPNVDIRLQMASAGGGTLDCSLLVDQQVPKALPKQPLAGA